MGDLITQIVFDLLLNLIFIEGVDDVGLDGVVVQERLVAVIELPERLVGPLPIDAELRGQF